MITKRLELHCSFYRDQENTVSICKKSVSRLLGHLPDAIEVVAQKEYPDEKFMPVTVDIEFKKIWANSQCFVLHCYLLDFLHFNALIDGNLEFVTQTFWCKINPIK